jgi:hypothetical protein
MASWHWIPCTLIAKWIKSYTISPREYQTCSYAPTERGRDVQYTPLQAVGVGRGADMSLTGFHLLWDKILSQNLQAVGDQGCHLEGFAPYKGTANRGYTVWRPDTALPEQ